MLGQKIKTKQLKKICQMYIFNSDFECIGCINGLIPKQDSLNSIYHM